MNYLNESTTLDQIINPIIVIILVAFPPLLSLSLPILGFLDFDLKPCFGLSSGEERYWGFPIELAFPDYKESLVSITLLRNEH